MIGAVSRSAWLGIVSKSRERTTARTEGIDVEPDIDPCLLPGREAVHGVAGSPANSCTPTHDGVSAVKGPGVVCA